MAIAKKSKTQKQAAPKSPVKAKPTVTKPAVRKSPATVVKSAVAPASVITRTERHQRIAEAAYFIALRKGFGNSDPKQNWIEAERQVDAELRGRGIRVAD